METPTHLSHKPIVHVQNYYNKDAQFSNETDAQSLSIGLAQWDKGLENHERAISAKVWRYNSDGNKWSRQSEELPLHRVIDLGILLFASLIKDEGIDLPTSNLGETIIPSESKNFKYIYKYYSANKKNLDPRIIELEKLIHKFLKRENVEL
jgi:hypothetical protein